MPTKYTGDIYTGEKSKVVEKSKSYLVMDEISNRIEKNFTYQKVRDAAKTLEYLIRELTPPSREQSLASTKLEEMVFWSNAAIARNE